MSPPIVDDDEIEEKKEEEEVMLSQMHGFHYNLPIIYAANGGIVALSVLLLAASDAPSPASQWFSITTAFGLFNFFLVYNVTFYIFSFGKSADREQVVQWMSVLTNLLTMIAGALFGSLIFYVYYLPRPVG